jgi:hypothetical protein
LLTKIIAAIGLAIRSCDALSVFAYSSTEISAKQAGEEIQRRDEVKKMKKIVPLEPPNAAADDKGDVVLLPRAVADEMFACAREAVINIRRSRELRTQFEKHGYTLSGVEENYHCEVCRDKAFLKLAQLVIDFLWATK